MSNFERINICSDGNCLFRSVATFLNKDLINCKRYNNGKPKSKNLQQFEYITASNLRKFVVFRLSDATEAEKYNNWQDYDSDEYDDIYDRIKHMMKNTTWAGMLELKQLSIMLNLKFNIYVLNTLKHKFNHKDIKKIFCDNSSDSSSSLDEDIEEEIDYDLNIISVIGEDFESECNLILEDNHFELLIFNDKPKYQKQVTDLKQVEIVEPFNLGLGSGLGLGGCVPHRYNLRSKNTN